MQSIDCSLMSLCTICCSDPLLFWYAFCISVATTVIQNYDMCIQLISLVLGGGLHQHYKSTTVTSIH